MKSYINSVISQLKFHVSLEKLTKIRFALLTFFFIGVATDVFYLKSSSDIFLFLLILLWLLVARLYHYTSIITFKIVLIYVLILFILFIFASGQTSLERLATWIYLFLVVGIIQQWREITTK